MRKAASGHWFGRGFLSRGSAVRCLGNVAALWCRWLLVQRMVVPWRWRLLRARAAAVARGTVVLTGSGTGDGSGGEARVVAETMRSSILQLAVFAEAVPVPLKP